MKVLIDRNIEIFAVTHRTEMVPKAVRWGPHKLILPVAQRVSQPPRQDEVFRRAQLPYLASLCNSTKHGTLEFFSAFELRMEELRQKGGLEGLLGINMLRDVPIKQVPSPIRRSVMIGATKSTGITEAEQLQFFRSIQHPRFLQIVKATGDAHIDDAFHLWTAEEAKLDVFLTMDQRFWRVVNQKRKLINTPISVNTPEELCASLGLEPTDIEKLASEINPFS